MPGSPPRSTSEPLTRPPPRSLSTSDILSLILCSPLQSISLRGIGVTPEEMLENRAEESEAEADLGCEGASLKVFHSPQAGHLPIHLGLS